MTMPIQNSTTNSSNKEDNNEFKIGDNKKKQPNKKIVNINIFSKLKQNKKYNNQNTSNSVKTHSTETPISSHSYINLSETSLSDVSVQEELQTNVTIEDKKQNPKPEFKDWPSYKIMNIQNNEKPPVNSEKKTEEKDPK